MLGGFPGIGAKRFALPWRALTPDANYRRRIVDVALMEVMALPVFPSDPWLQRVELTSSKENAYLLCQRARLSVTPPYPRSRLLD
jgi:hypothetical protein